MIIKDKSSSYRCQECRAFKNSFISVLTNQQLADLKDQASILNFRKGQKITTQQETSQGIYCIRSGIVKLFRDSNQATKTTLGFRTSGNLIGHHGIIEGKNILSVSCLTPVEACFFQRKTILLKAQENPLVLTKINAVLTEEMGEMIDLLADSHTKSIDQRLVESILLVEEKFGVNEDGYIAVPLTRQELSQLIGASIESVFRSLASLKKKRLIEVKKGKLKILDKSSLRQLKMRLGNN